MQSLAQVRYDINEYIGGHSECDDDKGVRIPYTLLRDIQEWLWQYADLRDE